MPSTTADVTLETCFLLSMGSPCSHPFAQRRAELVAELLRVRQPLADPRLPPAHKEEVISAYEKALRRVFALDEEAGID